MDYSSKSREELLALCKENNIKKYSKKNKDDLIALLQPPVSLVHPTYAPVSLVHPLISLFSGMGGMDVGFAEQVIVRRESILSPDYVESDYDLVDGFVVLRRLPFRTVFQNDILPAAQKVAGLNGWAHNYTLKDIRDILLEGTELPHAVVITGGFPCQDFSHAGKRAGLDSKRGTLYQSYVEVVKRVMPVIFIAENVQGLLTMPDNPIQKIMTDFASVGYEVRYQLIKCEDFGIPQTRHRVIIMGVRLDCRSKLAEDWNIITENIIQCPINKYFSHLDEPEISLDIAQQSYSKAAKLGKGQGQSEIKMNGFCPTMRAEHHGNIEFRRVDGGKNNEPLLKERRLTVREAALIQTFPPNCRLTENKPTSMAYKPIGNAVPPLLGYIIARKVQQILEQCI